MACEWHNPHEHVEKRVDKQEAKFAFDGFVALAKSPCSIWFVFLNIRKLDGAQDSNKVGGSGLGGFCGEQSMIGGRGSGRVGECRRIGSDAGIADCLAKVVACAGIYCSQGWSAPTPFKGRACGRGMMIYWWCGICSLLKAVYTILWRYVGDRAGAAERVIFPSCLRLM